MGQITSPPHQAVDAEAQKRTERRGLQLYLLNTFLGSVLGIFSKLAARDGVPFFELVLVRSLTLVCCTVPMLAAGHINPFGHHEKYWSLSLLPMSDVTALGFLSPIFVALLAPYVLGEPTSRGIFIAMPFSIALFSTGGKLSVRALAAANQPMSDIMFSFGFISLIGSATMCASMPRAWVLPSEPTSWVYIGVACALGYLVQASYTCALQKAKAAPAAACDYLSMTYMVAADALVFKKLPSTLSLCGSAIIVAASIIPLFWGHGAASQAQQDKGLTKHMGKQGKGTAAEDWGPDKPLKSSSAAEPEVASHVQLAKLSKYLGSSKASRGRGKAYQGSSTQDEGEAVGLLAMGSVQVNAEAAAGGPQEWALSAVARREALEGPGLSLPPVGMSDERASMLAREPSDVGRLQQVLMGAPTRTSSEKEALLQQAGR
ncbi:hypothetical protein N2152v2_010430 [Parachlorella kessleri]